MKQTTIDTSLLPKAWLTWDTTKATFWVECATNKKSNERPNIDFSYRNKDDVYYTSGSKPHWAYVKYHEDIEMLEVAAATFDTRRTAESHEWKYAGEKFFIDKQKNVFDANGNPYNPSRHNVLYDDYHWAYDFKNFLSMLGRLDAHPNATKEFQKFLGADSFTLRSGRVVEAKYIWVIQEWYIRKQYDNTKPMGKGKAQILVDKLTAIPLSDMEEVCNKYPVKQITYERGSGYYRSTYTEYYTGLIYFERVDDEWSVLRIFKRNNDGLYPKEVERMYINDKGTNRICTPRGNGWCTSKQFGDWWNNKYIFANREEAMQNSKRMKYITPLFAEDEKQIKKCLINALRFPEIEQLMKMGYQSFALSVAKSDTPKADMKEMFGGVYNEKEKNIIKKSDMNKHQFNVYMREKNNTYSNYATTALKEMRKFFEDDFIHLDNDTFDEFFNAFQIMFGRVYRGFKHYTDRYNLDYKRFMKNIVRIAKKNPAVYSTASDTLSMYSLLCYNNRPEVNWYFDSYSDMVRAHDAIMELKRVEDEERNAIYNAQRAEQMKKEEEKRKKMDKERQTMNYEDDNFIIRLPKDGAEIITEGSVQRICIGGYVSRHSLGHTNLFFLRKKSEPDKPFYAIEMNNDKTVVQIHGFGNRWLGNNPEAIPTVVRWLRKNNIKCSDHILTCTAIGYGSTNTHCPMPKVD